MDNELTYLLANPYHLKRKNKNEDLFHDLFLLLKKIYKNYDLNDNDETLIIQKIEILILDNFIDKFVNSIIQEVIHEFD